jgi:CRISPR system Cascade subunit CasB
MNSNDRPINLARALIASWRHFYPDPDRNWPGDSGGRAALRRAPTPEDVLMEPAFHAMLNRMQDSGTRPEVDNRRYMQIALIVGVLAERRDAQSGPGSFMQSVGSTSDDDERKLSALRFQALMTALDRGSGEEKMRALRRAMKLAADTRFNLQGFAQDLIYWCDETRIRWTFDYFGKRHQPVAADSYAISTEAEELS